MMVALRGRPLVVRVGMMLAALAALIAVAGWQWSAGRTEARLNEDLFVDCLSRAQTPRDARQCTVEFYDRRDQQLAQADEGQRVAAGVLLAEGVTRPAPTDPTRPDVPVPAPTGPTAADTSTDDSSGTDLGSALPDRPAPPGSAVGGEVVTAQEPSAPEPPPTEQPAAAPTQPEPSVTSPTTTCAAAQASTTAAPTSCPGTGGQGSQGDQALAPATGPGKARPAATGGP
ncbi:hypothetical protein ACK8HX_06920 [Oryzobacter sp. R7]|uniref:hypothetical protein n=1 Tax=Oryzobacter faecalis TaxID=3388656 RepID=UPI00398D181E